MHVRARIEEIDDGVFFVVGCSCEKIRKKKKQETGANGPRPDDVPKSASRLWIAPPRPLLQHQIAPFAWNSLPSRYRAYRLFYVILRKRLWSKLILWTLICNVEPFCDRGVRAVRYFRARSNNSLDSLNPFWHPCYFFLY